MTLIEFVLFYNMFEQINNQSINQSIKDPHQHENPTTFFVSFVGYSQSFHKIALKSFRNFSSSPADKHQLNQ